MQPAGTAADFVNSLQDMDLPAGFRAFRQAAQEKAGLYEWLKTL